ncbi:MAG: nucleotidyltransferase domain-containing protein [Terriglobia bacterium]|jgi:DNA-binding transcriptional ArsR family regulator
MDTAPNPSLASALFGRTRRAVLGWLYAHPDESFYLRELARNAGAGLGAVQREVKRLAEAGVIRRTVRGREVYYQADSRCPVFVELKGLIVKTWGLADILKSALGPLASRIRVAFVYGSFARRQERRTSDIDLMIVGEATFAEIVSALGPTQALTGRELNPTVYPPGEFQSKLVAGHHFLKGVVKAEKIFLIGDDRELERLAEKRLAQPTPKQSRRD